MKIVGVIPARSGSKGIKKKNIKNLNGKPLIAYTIEAAKESNLTDIYVSTDSSEIAEIASSLGSKFILRPSNLARDDSPTLSTLQHFSSIIKEKYDAIMTLQPTSPLRSSNDINKAIEIYIRNPEYQSLVSLVRVPHNMSYSKLMYREEKFFYGNNKIKPRQQVKDSYARNGAIYITSLKILNKSIFEQETLGYIMDKVSSIDIDDLEDWQLAEKLLMSDG